MTVSVIIVSYNVLPYLVQCIESVKAAGKHHDVEIIVYENNSSDKTVAKVSKLFPEINLIVSRENLGFAKANNIAVQQSSGQFIFILNPDTLIPEDFFDRILPTAWQHEDLGIIGPRMIDFQGMFHPESKRKTPTLSNTFSKLFGTILGIKNTNYYHHEIDQFKQSKVDILTGAGMFIRRKTYDDLKGFDERYFMYGEDVDLSFTALKYGYINYYNGNITLLHYKGQSGRKDSKYFKTFFNAMHIFVNKYYADLPVSYYLLKIGAYVRYIIALLLNYFDKKQSNPKHPSPSELKPWDETQKLPVGNYLLSHPTMSFKQIIATLDEYGDRPEYTFWVTTEKWNKPTRPNNSV